MHDLFSEDLHKVRVQCYSSAFGTWFGCRQRALLLQESMPVFEDGELMSYANEVYDLGSDLLDGAHARQACHNAVVCTFVRRWFARHG